MIKNNINTCNTCADCKEEIRPDQWSDSNFTLCIDCGPPISDEDKEGRAEALAQQMMDEKAEQDES